jgi:hypothetical protein
MTWSDLFSDTLRGINIYPLGYKSNSHNEETHVKFLSFMSTPVGRLIRVLMGLGFIGAGAAIEGVGGTSLQVFALLPILTGVFGLCPINPLVGRPIRCDEACRADVRRP